MHPISRHDKKVLLRVKDNQQAALYTDCDVVLVQALADTTVAVCSSSSDTISIFTDGTVSLASPDANPNVLLSCTNYSRVIIASKNLEDVLHTEDSELSSRLKKLQIKDWTSPEDPAKTTN